MNGAIIGDIVGSRFEFHNIKSKEFELFHRNCTFTDDTVMTVAIGKALSESKKNGYTDLEDQAVFWMHELGKRYPRRGYGGRFRKWLLNGLTEPYGSYGNGSGMRTSACARYADSLEEALELAKRCAAVTHNHPEGIKGAEAITACIYLARIQKSKDEIRNYVKERFYPLDRTLDEIRPDYTFDETCQGSVPEAIECFLESVSFEDCIRNAISIGGDSDTIAAMAGSIAEAFYGVPADMKEKADGYLDDWLKETICAIMDTGGKDNDPRKDE